MMAVSLQDVLVRLEAVIQRPESEFGDGTQWTAGDCGRQALKALQDRQTRQAIAFLKLAQETELAAASGTAFADVYALFRLWMDQVVATESCGECGAALGRECTLNDSLGRPRTREWIHAKRIPQAPGVLA